MGARRLFLHSISQSLVVSHHVALPFSVVSSYVCIPSRGKEWGEHPRESLGGQKVADLTPTPIHWLDLSHMAISDGE